MNIPFNVLKNYNAFLRSMRLVEKGGRLFIVSNSHREPREVCETREICLEENDDNHHHFDYSFGEGAYADFLANRWLAEGAVARIQFLLRRDFPKRKVVLFALNEVTPIADEHERLLEVKLFPTLRLWTAGAEGDEVLRSLRLADVSTPETAWCRSLERSYLVPVKDLNFECPFLGLKNEVKKGGAMEGS